MILLVYVSCFTLFVYLYVVISISMPIFFQTVDPKKLPLSKLIIDRRK